MNIESAPVSKMVESKSVYWLKDCRIFERTMEITLGSYVDSSHHHKADNRLQKGREHILSSI